MLEALQDTYKNCYFIIIIIIIIIITMNNWKAE